MQVTPSHDAPEETKYDNNLDQMLMQSSKTSNGKSCPVHPYCSTSESPSRLNKQTSETSTMLVILKHPCNINLQKLTDLDIKKWIKPTSELADTSTETVSDSDDDIPLSCLKEKEHIKSLEAGFSSEDDIPLIDFHKPCTRSHTQKKVPPSPIVRFPCTSKSNVSYEELSISDSTSDDSPARKKKKVIPLLLPGPSNDRLHAQGYISRNKSKEIASKTDDSDNTNKKDTDKSDVHDNTPEQEPTPPPVSPKGQLNVTTHGLTKQRKVWNFKCKLCDHIATSYKQLNNHHKTDHD